MKFVFQRVALSVAIFSFPIFFCGFFFTNVSAQFRSGSDAEAGLGVIVSPRSAIAECDYCLCSQGISPLEMGRTGVRYDVRYLRMDQQFQDGKRVANSSQQVETYFTNQFTFLFRIVNELSAIAILPYASRHASSVSSDAIPITDGLDNSGLGDLTLLGRYNLFDDHKFADTRIISFTAGVKLPTGSIEKKDAFGNWADPDLQLGTGSTDFLLGGGMQLGFDVWSLGATLLGGFTGTGARGHRYGDNLNYTLTGRYKIWPNDYEDPTIFAALSITGELRAHETQDGAQIDDSGGDVTYIAPGFQVFFGPNFSVDLSGQLPIVHALNGAQLGETFRILSGIQYMF